MNTIKIRETHPELIERIRKTMKDYKDWYEFRKIIKKEDIEEELDIYGNFWKLTRFLDESLFDDIEELSKVISEDEEERENAKCL